MSTFKPQHRHLSIYLLVLAALLFSLIAYTGHAQTSSLVPPDDPRQSITYWKSHTLSPENDAQVKQAHDIFSVLLRAWDSSRLDPGLYIVDSKAGPWAASLADGNILLSREAINVCMKYGKTRGQHLLAFVLAHELAHQRADDLWHQRFFRMVGSQTPSAQQHMMRGLSLDAEQLEQLEQKEAQADHDGLILMSSVGFNPHQVLDKKDFFTEWVENIWKSSCHKSKQNNLTKACNQAQSRALRTQIQLDTVASQSMLYQMGVQSFVARNYKQARHYFTVFGRDYPSRAVISALSMTYLAQAIELHQSLIHQGAIKQPGFYYPLILDANALAESISQDSIKRSSSDTIAKQKQQLQKLVNLGIKQLERAIALEPDHRKSYLMLASAYLLANNTYMARGVLQGRYLKRFNKDVSLELVLAMTSAVEGNSQQAQQEFQSLLNKLSTENDQTSLPQNLLLYSAFHNSAANALYLGDKKTASNIWRQLASNAKSSGNSLLFRMALDQIRPESTSQANSLSKALVINGYRLHDQFHSKNTHKSSELWIEGDKFIVNRSKNGSHFIVSDKGEIINAWQETGGAIEDLLSIGDSSDRPFKTLGLPDRHLHMLSGDYLAYDNYGLALHVNQNKIQGWFLY